MIQESEINKLIIKAKNDRIEKLVVGAFIINDGKFLTVKRAPNEDFLPNLDEIPSGGVDAGEDILSALKREVLEETGLETKTINSYINSFDYTSGSGKRARQFNFLLTPENDQEIKLNPEEHISYLWASIVDFEKLNFSEQTKKCLLEAVVTLSVLSD